MEGPEPGLALGTALTCSLAKESVATATDFAAERSRFPATTDGFCASKEICEEAALGRDSSDTSSFMDSSTRTVSSDLGSAN